MASIKHKTEFIEALVKELAIRKGYLKSESLDSVYFGGGTPSLLRAEELKIIFDAIEKNYHLKNNAEITLEANPDDIDDGYLEILRSTPINRLSIGVQSFHDEDLQFLNRIHSSLQAIQVIEKAKDNGFENLSIDLILGIPTLSDKGWKKNLDTFVNLKIPHLSAYGLTVEPKTPLDLFIQKGKVKPVEDGKIADHFKQLMKFVEENGYTHYETSNFCIEPHFAKHNTNYWKGGHYLGLGPSAHSYDGQSRQWNVSNVMKYIHGIMDGSPVNEKEILTTNQKFNEYIMVSLRTMWGVDEEYIESSFSNKYSSHFLKIIQKYLRSGDVIKKNSTYTLSKQGKLFTDSITAALFTNS